MFRLLDHRTGVGRFTLALAASGLLGGQVGCGGGGGGSGGSGIVAPNTLVVATTSIPDATLGVAYQAPLEAIGGIDPISWRIGTGSRAPTGIGLASTQGRLVSLAGTPTAAGNHTFTVVASDRAHNDAPRVLTLTVHEAPAITTATLPDGETRDAYTAPIQVTGGQAPFTWSIAGGTSLPAGLALDGSTTATVTLQGTPTAAGTSTFTIRVEDKVGAAAETSLTVRLDDIERYVFGGKLDALSKEQLFVTERVNGTPALPRILLQNTNVGSFKGMFPMATSPDGRYAAAIMDRTVSSAFDLWVVDLRGPNKDRIRLVNDGSFAGIANRKVTKVLWSPDSRWVAFLGDVGTASATDLFVADVSVPGPITPRKVTNYVANQHVAFHQVAFTNDSRHVVYLGDTNPDPLQNPSGQTMELFFVDLLAVPATPPARLSAAIADPAVMDIDAFAVAASGSGIVYRGDLVANGSIDVYHTTLSQGQAGTSVRVSDASSSSASGFAPSISPDGKWVLFTSGVSTTFVIDPTGLSVRGQVPFVVDLQAASPATAPLAGLDGHVEQPIWSSDSEHVLVYRKADDGAGNGAAGGELRWVNASTKASSRLNAATWDGATIDVAFQQGPWGPMGLDQWAYAVAPNGEAVSYKQQTKTGTSPMGTSTYRVDLFVVDVSGAAPAAAVQASPDIAGVTNGGIRGDWQFSSDSSKIVMTYRNQVAGNVHQIYVHEIGVTGVTLAGASTLNRLNVNTAGPKWTVGDAGLVLSGPLQPGYAAFNGVYFLDLVGGMQSLSPNPAATQGDVGNFFPLD